MTQDANIPLWAGLPPSLPVMRVKDVIRETGIPRTTLFEMIRDGRFPPFIRISERTTACPRTWVEAFLLDRAKQSFRGDLNISSNRGKAS